MVVINAPVFVTGGLHGVPRGPEAAVHASWQHTGASACLCHVRMRRHARDEGCWQPLDAGPLVADNTAQYITLVAPA